MERFVKKILPRNVEVPTAYTGKRLRSCFETKRKTKFEHRHDIVYQGKLSGRLYWGISKTCNRKNQRS